MQSAKAISRFKRHRRIRTRLREVSARPRLVVFRSLKHIYAQIVDDKKGHILASASDIEKNTKITGKKSERAANVGELLAKKAQEKGIKEVAFDRGGYQYHGRVKSVAEAAKKAGLVF